MRIGWQWRAVAAALVFSAGCQLVSGLDGLHHGGTGGGGAASPTAVNASSSSGGGNGVTGTASAGVGASSSATSMSSSSGGCSGMCVSVEVLEPQARPGTSIASDGTYVYWGVPSTSPTNLDGRIYRKLIAAEDSDAGTPVVTTGIDPTQIVTDGNVVAWFDDRMMGFGVYVAQVIDGGDAPDGGESISPGLPGLLLELDGGIYWSISSPYRISTAPALVPTAATGSLLLDNTTMNFAVDEARVYWAEGQAIHALPIPDTIADAGVGDAGGLYMSGASGVDAMVVGQGPGAKLYWLSGGMVMSAAKNGGGNAQGFSAMTAGNDIKHILVDAANLYWLEANVTDACVAPQIVRTPLSGGSAVSLTTLADGCITLVQDAANLLWLKTSTGAIYRLAK